MACEDRFPDDRVDNERFSGAAVLWPIIFYGFVLLLVVLFIVYKLSNI